MQLADKWLPLVLAFITLALAVRMSLLEERTRRMPGFNAGTVVEPLDYDFRTKDNPNAVHGVIREPNDRQIADFMSGIKDLVKSMKDKVPESLVSEDANPLDLLNAVDDLDPEIVVGFHADMAGLFAALCSGEPSRDQILALPIRIRTMFYGWLQREVMAPEAVPGGGNVVPMKQHAAAG